PAVAAEHASERGEDRSVLGFEARTDDLAFQDGELMAQHENLDILGTIPASTQHQQVDHESDKTVETGHAWILAASEPRRSCLRETAGHHAGRVFGTHKLDQPKPAQRSSPSMALSFLYRLVRRVFEAVRVHRLDAAAKDAEILVLCHTP